ncbi:MAG: helix-turn-helix domain-containing protein [Leptospirales bacterium]|nr:helix-turn-helix domain-containing protein [Leptospirales bacterium]
MESGDVSLIVCALKELRQKKGYTQSQLADMLGIKRQAIYDIESGRYLPNTLIALRLARILDVTVEDIFEEKQSESINVKLVEEAAPDSNIVVVKIRDKFIGYPLKNEEVLTGGIRSATGRYLGNGNVRLLKNENLVENTAALLGCDPAFGVLSSYVSASDVSVYCRFASSEKAIESLALGYAHVAGIHVQGSGNRGLNVDFARRFMKRQKFGIITFAEYEEGLIVAKGNPLKINSYAGLTNPKVRFVNREAGAAVRFYLEDTLKEMGIPFEAINGFDKHVYSHADGAQLVEYGLADAALGLSVLTKIYEVDFIPMSSVCCDLVIPADLWDFRPVRRLADILQTKKFRAELQTIADYNTDNTGKYIEEC